MVVRSSEMRGFWTKRSTFAWVAALLLLLTPLKDASLESAQTTYQRAKSLFFLGYLEKSQQEAERGDLRFRQSNPEWATKFQLLQAEAMVWRGMYEDALQVLSAQTSDHDNVEYVVLKKTLQGVSLARLQRFSEASEKLEEAQRICSLSIQVGCGGVSRGRGVLAMEKGQFSQAHTFYLDSLHSARKYQDRWLEATALLNLGFASLQDEHYDEAVRWSTSAYKTATELGGEDLAQGALGNQGWAYLGLGDANRALHLFQDAEKSARKLGDIRDQLKWLTDIGYAYTEAGKVEPARDAYNQALRLARQINSKGDISNILTDLALVAVGSGNPGEADAYASQAMAMAQQSGSRPDMVDALAIQMQAAALHGDVTRAEQLLREVESAPESQMSMKWASQHAIANLYEKRNQTEAADRAYKSSLATFEGARAQLNQLSSQLPFLANATRIYDDYIAFLIHQNKPSQALAAADWSRARTLENDLSKNLAAPNPTSPATPPTLNPTHIALQANVTILFYWLGEKQSWLWTISPRKTQLSPLPPKSEIARLVQNHNRALLNLEDPATQPAASEAATTLYNLLIAPAASLITPNQPVILIADGPLSQLNFETLLAPGIAPSPQPHYWIEDATLLSAPSLRMLAASQTRKPSAAASLLLLGDALSPDPDYPRLPMAAREITQIQKYFPTAQQTVLSQTRATPAAYLASKPENFSYIHFVAHGNASRTDPLDSAVILSPSTPSPGSTPSQDTYKLYARDILAHPIAARLVTISACNSSGTAAYAGEGLVGLSWAFLRAGAHNTIGTLWEVSDESTPQLMDQLYSGLAQNQSPATALRNAKLTLLHTHSQFRKPFYWAPFQLYAGH